MSCPRNHKVVDIVTTFLEAEEAFHNAAILILESKYHPHEHLIEVIPQDIVEDISEIQEKKCLIQLFFHCSVVSVSSSRQPFLRNPSLKDRKPPYPVLKREELM
jgi:hypothetical protein